LGLLSRVAQGVSFVVLLASGGLAAILLRRFDGGADWKHVLVAPDSNPPPDLVLGVAILLLAGPVAARLVPGGPRLLDALVSQPWAGPTTFIALMAVAGFVGGFSIGDVWAARDDGAWRSLTAWLALAVAPLAGFAYAFLRNPFRRLRARVPA
jgi:hypothetical protein